MKDTEYLFTQTSRERKQLARNAKYKKNGSKSRRCTLPSDNLTPAQLKRRNGTMFTYNLDQPHTLGELRLWPTDLRHDYMEGLLSKYNPSNEMLGKMLGISTGNVSNVLRPEFGIVRKRGGRRAAWTDEKAKAWNDFMGYTTEPEPVAEPESTPEPVTPEPEPVVQHRAGSPLAYDTISVTFTGTGADLIGVIQTGPLHLTSADTYTFTITATRKEG
jgi:hypothetical protein